MEMKGRKAILVVSFGTSFTKTRKETIHVIEQRIADAFPDRKIYYAWTSQMLLKKVREREGLEIDHVSQALERMKRDGIREVIVQPTHLLDGIENERMKADVECMREAFERIRVGRPLLAKPEDEQEITEILCKVWKEIPKEELLVLMGHGSSHSANAVYGRLADKLPECGNKNIILGTVEAQPSLDTVLTKALDRHPDRVHLAPFMIVAGDHAINDMAGEEEDSWMSRFRQAGFETVCHLRGLGEYKEVQEMFLRHVREAV
ncbi:MAG: sirohydrochlorin cobaltochelatase [Eubacteriales bacterium]|nr:sirohydrochlorin cobaltochelatase [Eubacteriales bacterium]